MNWNISLDTEKEGLETNHQLWLLPAHCFFYCSANSPFCNGITHGFECIVVATFYGILPFEMDEGGALFSLFRAVVANFHKRFYYPVKGVHLIVPNN